MYSFMADIRFSEVDSNKNLTLTSLINFFQDCTIFHSESLNAGFEYLEPRHRAWFLSSWQVIIHRLPRFGETIRVGTWPHGFGPLSGDRNFVLQNEEGENLVTANSFWVFTDTTNGRPAKLDPDYIAMFPLETPLDMEYAPRKIPLPATWEEHPSFTVLRQHLDTNYHVNNAQYIRMAEDYLPAGFETAEFRAEYKKPAKLQDEIYPLVFTDDTTCTVVLADASRKPYTTVQFIRKGK